MAEAVSAAGNTKTPRTGIQPSSTTVGQCAEYIDLELKKNDRYHKKMKIVAV